MFSKKQRLTERDVRLLFLKKSANEQGAAKNRYTLNSPSLSLVCEKSDTFKIGVAVQKKVCSSAVERNRLRRLVYQMFKNTAFDTLPAHVFVTVKKNINKDQSDLLKKEAEDFFKKLSSAIRKGET